MSDRSINLELKVTKNLLVSDRGCSANLEIHNSDALMVGKSNGACSASSRGFSAWAGKFQVTLSPPRGQELACRLLSSAHAKLRLDLGT